jgi:hypothetical protein
MSKEIKKLAVVIVTTLVSFLLHAFVPTAVPLTEETLTFIVKLLTFYGAAIIYFIFTYYVIATVFLKIESKLPGKKVTRGLIFGSLVGGVWWIGMIESVFVLRTNFYLEVLTGFIDFAPIVILCVLLSIFCVEEKDVISSDKPDFKNICQVCAIFAVMFLFGRGIRFFGYVYGYQPENIFFAFLWVFFFAIIIALNFIFLMNGFNKRSLFKGAFVFAFLIFGLHYTMFSIFMPLIFKGMFFGIAIHLLYDLFLVFIASLISLKTMDREYKTINHDTI